MTAAVQITSDLSLRCGPASVNPLNELRVATPASQIFYDSFDTGTLDVTNRWTAPTAGGTGIAATNSAGNTVLDGGTTANSFSKLTSQASFIPVEPGYLVFLQRINIEFPVVTTAHRFWGFGVSGASPTIAAPLTNAVGFEVATDGKLYAVTYASGTRLVVKDLSVATGSGAQPQDSNTHKYFVYFRGDISYWCIDDDDNVVANFQTGASGPDSNILPILDQIISNSGTHATIQVNACSLGDTSHTTYRQTDGTYGWRAQIVGARGDSIVSLMDGNKNTYSGSVTAAASVAGDTVVIPGSATKTVRVTRISVSGVATAAADLDITLIKRSAADTAGTSSAITLVPHDSLNSAATALPLLYTVAPTPGAAVGTARSVKQFAATATGAPNVTVWDFGNGPKQGIVLRGIAQQLCLNFSAALAGGSYDIDFELTEE